MTKPEYTLLLADDDEDDCTFFKDALEDLRLSVSLITLTNGVDLMNYLAKQSAHTLPDILFLDLNMPRKSGFECLTEIKAMDTLINLPIIIFSTSLEDNVVDLMYERGATYYIQKPGEFSKLKSVILKALTITRNKIVQPPRDHFILQPSKSTE